MFPRALRAACIHAVRPRGRRRLIVLLAGLVAIALWQTSFRNAKLDPTWRLTASSGLHEEHRFVYFLRHLGLFPVANEIPPEPDTEEGAERWLQTRGDTLVMELGHTIRYGELGKTFLYLPYAIWKDRTARLRVEPTHYLAFTIALLALFTAFWWARRTLLGGITVVLFGSNPFQLFEVYGNEEVFSWNITTAILILALHVPLLLSHPKRAYAIALPIATALLLATIRQVRTEPILIGGSALLAYLAVGTIRQRAISAATFVATLMLASALCSRWFDAEWEEAQQVVASAGGHPFPGERERHHLIWHPIWCGLGDFGEDRGYRWDDRAAAAYALPILQSRYGVEIPPLDPKSYVFDDYVDRAKKYYRVPYLLPHYSDVIRDKVLADVAAHPLWYASIILRRIGRVLIDSTPIAIAIRGFAIRIPFPGLIALPIAILACLCVRRHGLALLFIFPLPLSATALLIYSGRGVAWYGCFHLLPAAFLLTALVRSLDRARRLGVRGT